MTAVNKYKDVRGYRSFDDALREYKRRKQPTFKIDTFTWIIAQEINKCIEERSYPKLKILIQDWAEKERGWPFEAQELFFCAWLEVLPKLKKHANE